MSQIQMAREILRSCWRLGVREVVVCAGARNAPLVMLLSQENPFQVHAFFEERSAAFFALGKIVARGRPVAVITTSGTAAAELLPATIEADYQGLPLILLTADRPRRYRGSRAPQAIEQLGLYSHYVELERDVEGEWHDDLPAQLSRPIHLNVCFDEPLLDAPLSGFHFAQPVESARVATSPPNSRALPLKMQRPLVVVGTLPAAERASVVAQLRRWQRPLFLEAPSGLRGHPELAAWTVRGGERSLAQLQYDGVIRIGTVPTLRLWRDLESSDLPVEHFSQFPFSGLPRVPRVEPLGRLRDVEAEFTPWTETERERDRHLFSAASALFQRYPQSEPAWFRWLSEALPANARVFVGNSLPIREWDFAAAYNGAVEIFANRGVNGIDGLISTFLGLADREHSNWCVLGDLSALYDLSALWPARGWTGIDLNIVVINNGGGKIFQRLFDNPLFESRHQINFKGWAEMWNWAYEDWREPGRPLTPALRPRVIEITPDQTQTDALWSAWEKS